ncbi:MAG: tRNA (5-methylaminomethyl-2-thiouridine)(34)-methyltransferase MnmD [Bacteroidaceae bacterium]|nr:tRNA (5-methylaminomethyl-2-thiouridine)(34)-methyltransferase MnmD [Bacteroidaceae bacterium]
MKLEQTADGSYTLYVPELDEHYHSVKGALTESQHIFINMGLKHSPVTEPRILEIGLGTGLNCFLTLLAAEETRRKIHYTGIERFPLDEEVIRQLDYPTMVGKGHAEEYLSIHQAPWEEDANLSPWFTLRKLEGDFTHYTFEKGYDIIYFDAFAPEKQPEMWEQSLFNCLYDKLNEGGILTTYCAKGVVRRMLQSAGFTVERLPGPPGGKREILRATKPISE